MKPFGDNIPVTGQIPPPVSTIASSSPPAAAKLPATPPSAEKKPAAATHWVLPGGRDGMQGAVPKVLADLDGLEIMPAHLREALRQSVEAAVEGTDHNYVVLHANGHTLTTTKARRHIVMLDLETSHENI